MDAEALAIASVFHALEGRTEIRQWSELSLRSLPECPTHFHLHYIGQNLVFSLVLTSREVQKCSCLVKHIDKPNKFEVLILRKKKENNIGLAKSNLYYIITEGT